MQHRLASMRNRFAVIGSLSATLLAVSGCGGEPEPATLSQDPAPSAAGRGGKAMLFFWQAPTTMNGYLTASLKEVYSASIVIEPLAEYNENGDIVPALAAEIPTRDNGGVSDDGLTITWKLKPGVAWSDGTPLTAEDVVFTWQYCVAPGGGCALKMLFDGIASVEAVDDLTVRITFENPKAFPYNAFVSAGSPVLQRAQFANCIGEAALQCTEANFRPIGTGPYRVVEFRTNDTVLLELNPHYRGIDEGLPYFNEIVIKGGGSAAASARSVLQLGEADYAWNLQVDPLIIEAMAKRGRGKIVSAFGANVEFLFLNQTNPDRALGELRSEYADGANPHPFLTDPVVGRALSLAIDRKALVEIGYGDFAGRPTCNVWPAPPQASPNNDECLTQNLDLARKLLDEAGIVDTDGDGVRERNGVPLSILYQTSTNGVRQTTQELIKEWWAEIGVATELKNVNGSVFFGQDAASPDTLGKFYADVEMYANSPNSRDPETYMAMFQTSSIPSAANAFALMNTPRFYSTVYDALYEELLSTLDTTRRNEIVIELNDMLVRSYAVIPLIDRGNVSAHAADIEGVGYSGWESELWNIETWTRKQ